MPLELYWDGDCTAVRWYREKHRLDLEQRNSELWMQGAYIYQAIMRLSPILKPFVKNPKAEPYLEKPFPLTAEQAKVDKKARQLQQQETALAAFKAKVLKINEQRGGDGDATGRSGV